MTTLAEMVVRISADATRLNRGIASASRDVTNFAKRADHTGRQMQAFGQTSLKAGLAVGVGLGFAVKKGMEFDATMSTVKAATQASGKEFTALRKAALQWGSTTQFSASEVAEAMVEMGKAGFKTNQIMKGMPGVLDAAAASGESMATVSNIMVNSLTGFGMAAKDATVISDGLAYAANATTASIADFGEALKYVAPVAKSAGIGFHETNGALVALAKAGISGSQAGTNLRGVLLSMQAPTKRATDLMKKAGLSFRDSNGNMRPLAANVDNLKRALSQMSKSEADKFMVKLFGRENITAAKQFLEVGGKGLRAFTKESIRSKGAAKDFAAVLRDNLKGDMEAMSGAAETAAIKLSDDLSPALRDVAKYATDLLNAFNEMDPGTRKLISTTLAVAAAALTIVGVFGIVGGSVVRGVGLIASAVGGVGGAFTTMASRGKAAFLNIVTNARLAAMGVGTIRFAVLSVIAIFAVLAAAFVLIAGTTEQGRAAMHAAWTGIKAIAEATGVAIMALLEAMGVNFHDAGVGAQSMADRIGDAFAQMTLSVLHNLADMMHSLAMMAPAGSQMRKDLLQSWYDIETAADQLQYKLDLINIDKGAANAVKNGLVWNAELHKWVKKSEQSSRAVQRAINAAGRDAQTFAGSIIAMRRAWEGWHPKPIKLTITQQIQNSGATPIGPMGPQFPSGSPLNPRPVANAQRTVVNIDKVVANSYEEGQAAARGISDTLRDLETGRYGRKVIPSTKTVTAQ